MWPDTLMVCAIGGLVALDRTEAVLSSINIKRATVFFLSFTFINLS